MLLKALEPNISLDNFLFCAVPPSNTTNSSAELSQALVISVSSVRSTSTASAVTSINAPAPTAKDTSPVVPPPVRPSPAATAVMSPPPPPPPPDDEIVTVPPLSLILTLVPAAKVSVSEVSSVLPPATTGLRVTLALLAVTSVSIVSKSTACVTVRCPTLVASALG